MILSVRGDIIRKFIFLITLLAEIVTFQILINNVTFAAPQKIAVVIVSSDEDFKNKSFEKIIKDYFGQKNDNVSILSGNEVQEKYQQYWFDKDLLEEGTPKKEDLIEFVSYGNYDKVIYLMIKKPELGQAENGGVGGGYGTPIIGMSNPLFSASVTVNSFLVDKNNIIKMTTSTNNKRSRDTAFDAKKRTFKRCVMDISETLNSLL